MLPARPAALPASLRRFLGRVGAQNRPRHRRVAAAGAPRAGGTADAASGAPPPAPAPPTAAARALRLAAAFGVRLHPGLAVGDTPTGLGLVWTSSAAAAAAGTASATGQPPQRAALASVPLALVLSAAIPGCAPAAAAAPELRALLADAGAPWEFHLAGLLLWAAAGPAVDAPSSGGGAAAANAAARACPERAFWSEYARVIPPAAGLASLLLWRDAELEQLQVRPGFDRRAARCARRRR
jgi:hypothetical protein